MAILLIIILSFIGHFVGDYILQTDFLAKAKSEKFWENTNDKHGWIMILLAHSVLWSAAIMLPWLIAIYPAFIDGALRPTISFAVLFITNVAVHFFVDNLKCKGHTTLALDQILHFIQIACTSAIMANMAGV